MNFIIYAIKNKKSHKIEFQGFGFVNKGQGVPKEKLNGKESRMNFLEEFGYDPKMYDVTFAQFTGLKKVRKAFARSLLRKWRLLN